MGLSFRKADTKDGKIIKNLFYYAIFVPDDRPRPPKSIVEEPMLEKYHSDWGRAGDMGYIAYMDEKAVGAAWIRLLNGSQKGYGYVDEKTPELSIAVLPEFRNQGIGNRLIQLIAAEAGRKYQKISLSVTKENPARRLYDRSGFMEISERGNDIIMIKVLGNF